MKKSTLYIGLIDFVAAFAIIFGLVFMALEIITEVISMVFKYISSMCSKVLGLIAGNPMSAYLMHKRDEHLEVEEAAKMRQKDPYLES